MEVRRQVAQFRWRPAFKYIRSESSDQVNVPATNNSDDVVLDVCERVSNVLARSLYARSAKAEGGRPARDLRLPAWGAVEAAAGADPGGAAGAPGHGGREAQVHGGARVCVAGEWGAWASFHPTS